MNGLDSITDAIINEARQQASENIRAAQEEKAVLISRAEEKLSSVKAEHDRAVRQKSDMIIERAKANALQYQKQQLMKTKIGFIEDVINSAKEKIKAMPPKEYFAAMERLIIANAHKADGVISFGARDIANMPDGFIDAIRINGGTLTLDTQPADIDGGFIIRYGDIEENCSLESIFRFEYDRLCDIISRFIGA